MDPKNSKNISLILIFYFFTSLLRVAGATLPFFPMGFSPMESLSLFSTKLIQYRYLTYLFPLLIIISTDSFINYFFTRNFSPFYSGFYWQYLSYFLLTLLGQAFFKKMDPANESQDDGGARLDSGARYEGSVLHEQGAKKISGGSWKRVVLASITGSAVFFLVSNFGVWASSSLYPLTKEGLLTCYFMALPFYAKNLVSTLFFSMIIYGLLSRLTLKITHRELQT